MNNILAKVRFTSFISLFLFLFSLPRVEATTLKVDCDKGNQNIQSNINEAGPGDVIEVRGTCNENLIIPEEVHRITLDGQGTATINGQDATISVIRIRGRGITIRGFTITGGKNGISAISGTATIDDNTIENTGRHGVAVSRSGSVRIVNNTIQNNPNIGIIVTQNSFARIGFLSFIDTVASPNMILNNGISGILVHRSSSAIIVGNDISSNTRDGVLVQRVSQADLAENTIDFNRDGIRVQENSGVTLASGTPLLNGPNVTTVKNTGKGRGWQRMAVHIGPPFWSQVALGRN